MKPLRLQSFMPIFIALLAVIFSQSLSAQSNSNDSTEDNEVVQENNTAPATTQVEFENIGRLPVKVYKSSSTTRGELVSEIRPQSTVKIPVSIGDEFEVIVVDNGKEKEGYQPKIYITDVDERIFLYGNVPMSDFAGKSGFALRTVDYTANLIGVNEVKINYNNLINSLNSRQIFEPLDEVSGADYTTSTGRLMKFGFDFSATGEKIGEFKSHMSYGYSSFAKGWSIGLAGKAPAGESGWDLAGDFAYGEKESETKNQRNIYTYSREQSSQYTVRVDKYKARLHPEFKQAVRTVKTAEDVKRKIIDVYGTHFITTMVYGGERSAYVRMTSDEYTKAKSLNLNIKGSVTQALSKQTDKDVTKSAGDVGKDKWESTNEKGTETTKGGYGGSGSIGYEEGSQVASVLSNSKSQYRMLGGNGGFNDWSISEASSVPIGVNMQKIYELVEPGCFKDNTPADLLAEKKELIKQAVEDYLKDNMPEGKQSGIKTPAPRVYEITLTKMEVVEEVDDANKKTRGTVTLAALDNSQQQLKNQGGNLWNYEGYSTDFEFKKGKMVMPNTKQYVTQIPVNGDFGNFYIELTGDIWELDDIEAFGGHLERPQGAGPERVNLKDLKLEPGAPIERSFDISFTKTLADRGQVRLTYSIMLMPSEFDAQLF